MRIEFRLVDVFTDRPLAGNQLCVVPNGAEVPAALMQQLALEIGFSETTFVTSAGAARYAMRIFTPATEMPFAGHPSLGTAFVLASEGRIESRALQSVAAGEFELSVDVDAGTAWMRQGRVRFGPEADPSSVAGALGLRAEDLDGGLAPEVGSCGLPHLMVGLSNPGLLSEVRPDLERLGSLLRSVGADGAYMFVFDPLSNQALARMFGPGVGIVEDPATGSAAGPLGGYLVRRGRMGPGRLTIDQGREIGRPSTLLVDVEERDGGVVVSVGGGVRIVGSGSFDIPR